MKLRQLEYFCAVAEAKSISAAARELHVAQPPISRQIAQLEEELGVQLFLRGCRGEEFIHKLHRQGGEALMQLLRKVAYLGAGCPLRAVQPQGKPDYQAFSAYPFRNLRNSLEGINLGRFDGLDGVGQDAGGIGSSDADARLPEIDSQEGMLAHSSSGGRLFTICLILSASSLRQMSRASGVSTTMRSLTPTSATRLPPAE